MKGHNEVQYVYKYVDNCGDVAYVGITNNLHNRVMQHKHDKLQGITDPTIYYFPVRYRGDAEMLETYLIDHYRTGKRYNVSKTKKGNFSFLDICEELPWKRFDGTVDIETEPFQVSHIKKEVKEVVVEKEVEKRIYVNEDSSIEKKIQYLRQQERETYETLAESIRYEKDQISELEDILKKIPDNELANEHLRLKKERLAALEDGMAKGVWSIEFSQNTDENSERIIMRLKETWFNLSSFEEQLTNKEVLV